MSLIGNKSILYKSPATFIGGGVVGLGMDRVSNPSQNRLRYVSENYPKIAATPAGYANGWILPIKGGDMRANFGIDAAGSITPLNLAGGLNAESTLAGLGEITNAETALIMYAIAALEGTGSVFSADATAQLNMALEILSGGTLTAEGLLAQSLDAAATLGGTATMTAAMGALAGAMASISGTGSASVNATAKAWISADLTPFTELSPQSLATAVWAALLADNQDPGSTGEALFGAGGGTTPTSIWQYAVEGGYSAEEILRLLSAAMAGKVSGADTSEIRFRDLADTKNRIISTVDGNGNRVAITHDVQ